MSTLHWADTGEKIDLSAVAMAYDPEPPAWEPVWAVSPEAPGLKTRAVRNLKIQLGLKCNYACSYCNQASQPHDSRAGLSDVQAFLRDLPTWFDGGTDGKGSGVRIELWGGEPLVLFEVP